MPTDNLTWVAARASGILGYLLITASVAFGVALSLKIRTTSWPRYVTTEMHRRITLLTLVFTAVHGITLWLDPFQAFSLVELVVPGASHYRPVWIAIGIIAGDLMLALWLSEYARSRIGYQWWRRLHFLTFGAWILVTIHGLSSGSDTRAPWAVEMYAAGTLLVTGLVLIRLWPLETLRKASIMVIAAAGVWLLGFWSVTGPLRLGWNAVANNGNGSGQVQLTAADGPAPTAPPAPDTTAPPPGTTAPPALGALPASFQATFTGQIRQAAQADGSWRATIDGSLRGGLTGQLTIDATETVGGAILSSTIKVVTADGAACTGSLGQDERGRLAAACTSASGQAIQLRLQLTSGDDGAVTGTVSAGRQGR